MRLGCDKCSRSVTSACLRSLDSIIGNFGNKKEGLFETRIKERMRIYINKYIYIRQVRQNPLRPQIEEPWLDREHQDKLGTKLNFRVL